MSKSGVFLESSACVSCARLSYGFSQLTEFFIPIFAGLRSACGWSARDVYAYCVCRMLSSRCSLRGVALGCAVWSGEFHVCVTSFHFLYLMLRSAWCVDFGCSVSGVSCVSCCRPVSLPRACSLLAVPLTACFVFLFWVFSGGCACWLCHSRCVVGSLGVSLCRGALGCLSVFGGAVIRQVWVWS